MTVANAVTAKNIIVEYKTARGVVRALGCDVFAAEAGASVAIMGKSGCGKSTLLGILAGLATPTEGTASIGETAITSLSESERVAFRKKNIGVVYQADNLLPFLSVSENIYLQLALCSDTADADQRVSSLLEKLGLKGLQDRLPDQLSGGQRQRVAIARAIIHKPALILADEPTGALDGKNAANVIELLLSIHKQLKSTLIVVTHDADIAKRLQRTVSLKAGGNHADNGAQP